MNPDKIINDPRFSMPYLLPKRKENKLLSYNNRDEEKSLKITMRKICKVWAESCEKIQYLT